MAIYTTVSSTFNKKEQKLALTVRAWKVSEKKMDGNVILELTVPDWRGPLEYTIHLCKPGNYTSDEIIEALREGLKVGNIEWVE